MIHYIRQGKTTDEHHQKLLPHDLQDLQGLHGLQDHHDLHLQTWNDSWGYVEIKQLFCFHFNIKKKQG